MFSIKTRTRTILLIIGVLILGFLMWFFSNIVTYILLSVMLAFAGRPLMHALDRFRIGRFALPRALSAFLTLVSLWILFFLFFRFLVPLFLKEVETFSSIDFEQIFATLQEPLSRFLGFFRQNPVTLDNSTFLDLISEQLNERFRLSSLSNILNFIASTVGDLFIGFFSVSFITFFFLKDESTFRDGILLFVPSDLEEKVGKILDSIARLLRRYFLGILLEMIMVGVLYSIGLMIVGLDSSHAIFIGLFCGLFNIIPYIGPWIGAMTGLMIGLALNVNMDFMSHTLPLLGLMALVFVSVKTLDDILFQPLIYSSSVKAHPLEIFLVILASGSLAGIMGMILAIPVYTILRVIAKEFFDNLKFVKKITRDLDNFEKESKTFSGGL